MLQRILAVIGPMAGSDPGRAGQAGAEVLNRWRTEDRAIRNQNLQLALGLENQGEEADNARFRATSAEHGVAQDNRESAWTTRNTNITQGNQDGRWNAEQANASARASASLAAQLAIANFERQERERQFAQQQILLQGRRAGFNTMSQSIGDALGPQAQAQWNQDTSRAILARIISEAGGSSQALARMREISGNPRLRAPPRAITSPAAQAEWYAANGVRLDDPDILNEYQVTLPPPRSQSSGLGAGR